MRHRAKEWRRNHRQEFNFRKLHRAEKRAKQHRLHGKNRHHLINKCRGGDFSPSNILILNIEKHNEWHRLFKNSDPQYIIDVLTRMCRMKGYPLREEDV